MIVVAVGVVRGAEAVERVVIVGDDRLVQPGDRRGGNERRRGTGRRAGGGRGFRGRRRFAWRGGRVCPAPE